MFLNKSLVFISIICILQYTSVIQTQESNKTAKVVNFVIQSNNNQQKINLSTILHSIEPVISFWQKIKQNKWRIIQISILTSWTAIQSSIWYLEKQLNDKNCWSLWHNEKQIEELFAINQKSLAIELLNEIQARHGINNVAIRKFLSEIEKEEKHFKIYRNIIEKINCVWLNTIFWFNNKLQKEAANRLQRLAYLSNIILSFSNSNLSLS